MPDLRLEVSAYVSASEWRWVLTDNATGTFLADHEVHLDPSSWQFESFTDLNFYASWHAAPDRQADDETRIAAELGDWIGAEVLGPTITAALAAQRAHGHATVRVKAPHDIALRPLELARIDDKPLDGHDITLVMTPPGTDTPIRKPPGERLRILGLFSLPEGEQPANLRQARHSLVTLVRKIEAEGGAADITVLQYGVTRDRLRDALLDGEGWDIIHIAGHGAPGELVLETEAGRPDRITATDLSELLDLARARVKLVTIAACQSAAGQDQPHDYPERIVAAPPSAPASLASELAASLNCAVLAMRFGVTDEFASDLTAKLYELVLDKGRDLPSALAITLQQIACRDAPHPALSVAAPALFGASAAGLVLKAPRRPGPRCYSSASLTMAGFPPPPDRFVGRTAVMTRASGALASESGLPGVVLHGMPGGGKTACALELAYGHEHAFDRLVWFKAPDEDSAIDGSLTDFALTLERDLPGFQMIGVLADDQKLTAFLPQLTELLERSRILLVIDNGESLLTDSGQWRDPRWGSVIGALTSHDGLGRVVMTTRRVSVEMSDAIVRESVDTLSPGEALLLARELPNLRQLPPGELAEVLRAAGGHPKLLEIADGQAADPERLAALIESDDPPSSIEDYLHVLTAWTVAVTGPLSSGERDLFWFLCCLEESDRERPVVSPIWPHLWESLGRDGDPPALDQALSAVAARSLTAIREESGNESYAIHLGVAFAGRDQAGTGFGDVVDIETAAFWDAMYRYARGEAGDATVHTGVLVRAGLAAVPYLTRQQQWDTAAVLLHNAFIRDPTRANAAAVLPAIQHIIHHEPHRVDTLARVLRVLNPGAAETHLRTFIDGTAARGDYRAAYAATGQLINLCLDSGRLSETHALTRQRAGYTRLANLGPWTRLNDDIQRLRVLNSTGHARQVFHDVHRLRKHLDTLPADPGPDESAVPWHVREQLLDAGRTAAFHLGRWQDALDLNAALITSKLDRRALAAETARNRFNDNWPLLCIGCSDDALALLLDCRQAFHKTHDTRMLGKTLSALASIEIERGNGNAAIRFEHDALRYKYLAGDVADVAVSHHNLGIYLGCHTDQPAPVLSNHLTAALICALTGIDDGTYHPVHIAALDLRASGTATEPPTDVADLRRKLGDIPGTDPAGLIARLAPDPATAERTLQDLIAQAQALAEEPPDDDHEQDTHPDDGNEEPPA